MPLLFILLLSIPLIELYFLFQVSDVIGGFNTIALVVLTAVAGTWLIRQQGLATLMRAQQSMQMGQLPAKEMIEGLMLVIAGITLVTPGFITDFLGFMLLIPQVRTAMFSAVSRQFRMQGHFQQPGFGQQSPFEQQPPRNGGDFIEGEYKRDD